MVELEQKFIVGEEQQSQSSEERKSFQRQNSFK